ncbi:cupin domain-containing protein [Sphingomonas sp.]|uniref:cupin domain-containing protein n=1 Tax=Sphingomonas sp. TaxID=28214 RepID=UPI001831F0CB|nr:cupin domain-containing protein [Sphingomonas sp.]MBA3510511.1 cupin domain-containing protein [Sphingomonas sp.]
MINKIAFIAVAALAAWACDRADTTAEVNQPQSSPPASSAAAPADSAAASGAAPVHKIVAADQVSWGAGPPSLPAGAQAAVLHGDPAKEGLFVLRLKMPAGYSIAPHTHPKPEIVTVVSGAFNVGMGETADKAKAQRLAAGSFFAFDPGMAHYAHADEETVIQINSTGPWGIDYINPADDPRKKN